MLKSTKFWMLPVLAVVFLAAGITSAPAQPKPDYIINDLTYSPTNPDSEDIITITAVVRNNGDDTPISSVLEIELDSETIPTTYTVPGLIKHTNFNQIRTIGPLTPGSHSVTATADATNLLDERKEDNNDQTINIDVTAAPPDLIVDSLTHWPPTSLTGEMTTITAIVKNQGDQDAEESILEILISNEGEPSTHTIPLLAPDASYQVEREVIFTQVGVYDVNATADADDEVTESNEDNNITTDSITVESSSGPDLVVTLDHDPADPTIDDTLEVIASVENIGDDTAGTSTLEIDFGGLNGIETFEIPPLEAAEIFQIDRQFINPSAGDYQVAATADLYDEVDETREYNNTDSDDIHVSAPDLVVSALNHAPANPTIIDDITITAIVENIGDAPATTSTLELDVEGDIETYEIPSLAPAETHQVERQLVLGVSGSHAVNAAADINDDVNESDEGNNTAMDTIEVSDMPDLIVSSLDHSPQYPLINDTITLTAVVKNIGGETATTSTLELDVEGEAGPITFTIPILVPDETSEVQIQVVKAAAGTYEVTATADLDGNVEESNEDNNVTDHEFTVREPGPDLIVDSLTHLPLDPLSLDSVTVIAVVKNVGDAAASSSTLEIDVEGDIVTYEIPGLDPMESHEVPRILGILSIKTYNVVATADVNDDLEESLEDNNTAADSFTVVQAPLPDLVISALNYAPTVAFTDQTITITAEVENDGNADATTSTLWILVGAELDPAVYIIPPLAPTDTKQVERQLILTEPGSYLVTATADVEDDNLELDETNNADTIDISVYNSDTIKLKNYLLGIIALTEDEKPFYDINQDGIVDIADLISLLVQ
jgi:subtilase family serine protease